MRAPYSLSPHSLWVLSTMLGLSLTTVAPAYAFDWSDLWFSAEQRAARQFEQQQYDELIDSAPDANWRGLGEYRKGDYSAAAKSFEELRGQAEEAGATADANRAIYNQANAHVLEENYPAAISLFDELLESDPLHANAKHNRDIAQQLFDQQQEQQQQSGEQGEQSDENQSDSDGERGEQGEEDQEDQQSGENDQSGSDSSEQNDGQQQDAQSPEQPSDKSGQGSDTEPEEASASAAEQQAEEEAAAAEAAMQAERERQTDAQQSENAQVTESAAPVEPLTEREQANEQWLRQIPDDPAGLLERKIHNRHITDFPKVIDSEQPW